MKLILIAFFKVFFFLLIEDFYFKNILLSMKSEVKKRGRDSILDEMEL